MPLAMLVLAGLVYFLTLAPTIGWGDSADLALRIVSNVDHSFDGTSRDYVFWRAAASLFQAIPYGDAATRANLFTAFCGALTVGIIAFTAHYLTGRAFAGVVAGGALLVSHSFWFLSVTAEVYTFNAVLVFGCYAVFIVWWRNERPGWLVLAAVLAGLALFHHASGLILVATLAPALLLRLRQLSVATILLAVLGFFAASAPYWLGVYPQIMAGRPFLDALGLATPDNALFNKAPLREAIKFAAFAFYNFPAVTFLLIVLGKVAMVRQRLWQLLPMLAWAALLIFAGITSTVPDKFNIYVMAYPALAVLAGVGAAALSPRWAGTLARRALIVALVLLVPPAGYAATVAIARQFHLDLTGARQVPFRDTNAYFLAPWKQDETGPHHFAERALAGLDHGALLLADYTLFKPLLFVHAVGGVRPDVQVIETGAVFAQGIAAYIATVPCDRAVYLASDSPPVYYQLDRVATAYRLVPAGGLFRVEGRCAA